jgi:chemotaxis protein CheZ
MLMSLNDLNDPPDTLATAAPELFQQLEQITRRLQDTLGQLDALPRLQQSVHRLPEARGRLGDIAAKSFEAADKVLTAVDQAKQQRRRIAAAAARLRQAAAERPPLLADLAEIEVAAAGLDAQLTDIMVAQDFHDLSGQMLSKVAALASELEDGLQQLLRGAAPVGPQAGTAPPPGQRARSQREVDELLASHGF